MLMKFDKMHGCGNDYIYVSGFDYKFDEKKKEELAIRLSDRHFGIGSDGLIFINPSDIADFEMEMYNADGSRSEMCGNGMRCVAKYVYDHKLTDKTEFVVESMGKLKYITLTVEEGKVLSVTVDMGEPILTPAEIPVMAPSTMDKFVSEKVRIDNREFNITCVSMGNPHAVIFTDPDDVLKYGPHVENNKLFPRRVNAEFVKVIDRNNVQMRVWERGTGETLACGTGCCATAVACVLNGVTDNEVTVHVLGGKIKIKWNKEDNHVYMTGPASFVFSGQVEV